MLPTTYPICMVHKVSRTVKFSSTLHSVRKKHDSKALRNFFLVTHETKMPCIMLSYRKENSQRECSSFEYLFKIVSIYFLYLLWWVYEDDLCSLFAVVGGATVGERSLQ
jgi:hypothetical protein